MVSFDTNLAVYAANSSAKQHAGAKSFLESLAQRHDVVVCEYMLVELYLKLRNPIIFPNPFASVEAVEWCTELRQNPKWQVVESAPVMSHVWKIASDPDFAFRRIIDARMALTLRHFGVHDFATTNLKDFSGFGFERVWNPLTP